MGLRDAKRRRPEAVLQVRPAQSRAGRGM